MMKLKMTALALMACASTTLMAQDWSFGAKAGLNLTGVSNSEMGIKAGYSVGGIAKYNFNSDFAFKGEILFSGQGAQESEDGVEAKFLLNYLNVPMLASYNIIDGFSIGAGIQPGFLLGAKGKATAEEIGDGASVEVDVMEECNKIDFSIPVEVCYDFENGIHIGMRYAIGVTDVFKYNDGSSMRNQVFNISVGYMF